VDDYFDGGINQLLERCTALKSKIPRDLPVEFNLLRSRCVDKIETFRSQLTELAASEVMRHLALQEERLRSYRRIKKSLDYIEHTGIATLLVARAQTPKDQILNQLIVEIQREIRYPLVAPTISPLSRTHFVIDAELNLLSVPLLENNYLLHLPDVFHELFHPLLWEENDRQVEVISKTFLQFANRVNNYFVEELREIGRRKSHANFIAYTQEWHDQWVKDWLEEFFCDLFATFTVGPAYGWSHLHLHAKNGGHAFAVPKKFRLTHPADAPRMALILQGLEAVGFKTEASQIEAKWKQLLSVSKNAPDEDYRWCYPDSLLSEMVPAVLRATEQIKCKIIRSGETQGSVKLLNDAWNVFWTNPKTFVEWERGEIARLQDTYMARSV
jgi:hypothetical protein